MDSSIFAANLSQIRARLAAVCARAGRDASEVRLLPVTKNHPAEAARLAFAAGLRAVGENRVQEALEKMDAADPALEWELIGPLQSNKARKAAERFARIQTVDRPKIARALQERAEELGRRLRVLLQINAGDDPAKSGASLADAPALLEASLGCPNLVVEGLMTIAPLSDDPEVARRCFAALRGCRDRLAADFGAPLPELSMGMSDDLEAAVLEGSTMVRVGSALYGARNYASQSAL